MRRLTALLLASTAVAMAAPAQAEPLRIGIIESLSGSQTSTGRLYSAAVQYGVDIINAAGGFNGEPIEVIEYDNAGGSTGAADEFRQAVADGIHIVFQGASSAVAGQITEDVRRHNIRNPGDEVMYINLGAEAMSLTGDQCHFYHFRYATTAPMRVNALVNAMAAAGELGTRVFSINQNYSWGQDMQTAIEDAAAAGGYEVVEAVLHDVNSIQDFAPYVARINAADPDTVITGNWSNDLLLLMRAASEAGLDVRFGTTFLDQPGNIANAGDTAIGHYLANNYVPDAGPAEFNDAYRDAVGHYPIFVEPPTIFAVGALAEALEQVDFGGGDIDVSAIALALEAVVYESPVGPITVRAEDHQTIRPVVVSHVVRGAAYPVDDTDLGFEVVGVVSGEDAIYPVQDSCEMERPD